MSPDDVVLDRPRRSDTDLLGSAIAALDRLRADGPLVHCLTNDVVVNFTANALLAIGAAPAMVDIPEESGMFAGVAGGVLVNLGTPHAEQRAAMEAAVAGAGEAGTPWVLDPVAIGALPVRTELAHRLRDAGPAVVRGNASEILALAGAGAGDVVSTRSTRSTPRHLWRPSSPRRAVPSSRSRVRSTS